MFATPQHTELEFGAVVNQPKHKEGYCTIDQIPALAKATGVAEETGRPLDPGGLPFSGNARYEGERWQLRIDAPAMHNVDGAMIWACRWVFSLGSGGADQNR